jgi:ribosomal protein S8
MEVYLKEVTQAQVYLILIGKEYGFETPLGISPTELEYNLAQEGNVFSLAFIKNETEAERDPKEQVLFHKIQNSLSYKRFTTTTELLSKVTKALVVLLQQKGILRYSHLAEAMYQEGYIERFGTGTGEMLRLCKEHGLPEPIFNLEEGFKVTLWWPKMNIGQTTDQVTDQVNELIKRLILITVQAYSRQELMNILQLKHNPNFRDNYLNPVMVAGFIEMTIPDKPNSTNQKYRLTKKGQLEKTKLDQDA